MYNTGDLIIFTTTGTTYRFSGVEQFDIKDGVVSFRYFGVSTQQYRKATFLANQVAGYSFVEVE